VNKVVGSIQISPGRSYQAGSRTFQDLVPYLRDDNNPHDFSHIIHEFFFMADDEYNYNKAKVGNDMKQRLGIADNPLDDVEAKVTFGVHDFQCSRSHNRRRPKRRTCISISSKSYQHNSARWKAKL
jgi:hypothetical protein